MRIHTTNRISFRRLGGLFICSGLLLILSGCPFAGPTAAFTASPTEGDAPLTVSFIDQSINGGADIITWLWDFGDGAQSSLRNPEHTYTTNGTFRVSLRVASNNGTATETKTDYIVVRAVPNVAFSATPRTGNTPLTVQFQDESTAAPFEATAWRWTFGDGEVSTEQHPAHVYEQPGTYNVSLTVTSEGGTNIETQDGYIIVAELPSVTFEATPTLGSAPLEVQFTDTSSPGSASIESWTWVFGDGGTSTEQNPTYLFDTPGVYSVSLTTRTAAGEVTGSMTDLITVTQAPVAAFSATPTTGSAPLVVSFVDESSPGTSSITDWLWDFNDGTSSAEQNPIHEFAEAGTYDITLTVTTVAGTNAFTRTEYIVAQAPPSAAFNASIRRGEAPLTVEFTDTSTAGASPISGRQWNFGDAATSGEMNPVHVYTEPGLYTVSLRVQGAVGSDIHVEVGYIEVVALPAANFTGNPTNGESPLTVEFIDTSESGTSPITTWLWDFGDGTTSGDQHPTRIYTEVGTYTVKLAVTTEEGTNTTTREAYIQVRERPKADFTADTVTGAAPLAVQFRDVSTTGSETITGRTWDFGDGTTSPSEDPLHIYTAPGVYTVTLNLATTSGPVSETKSAFITVDPAISFTATPDSNQAPTFVSFMDTTDTGPLAVTARLWDFGDGQTSNDANPIHQYTTPGSYDVSLTLTTAQGDATRTQTAAVNLRPTPVFSGAPLSGTGGPFTVQFEDQTVSGDLPITGWEWNFGDGTQSTEQNPSHDFAEPGLYAVSLTVITDIGNSTTTQDNYVSVRPAAAFSADTTSGTDSLTVAFTDETLPGNLSVLSWQWDFGDGNASTMQNPTHSYSTPGTYTVALTTNSSEGADTETKAGYIVVEPLVDFSADVVAGSAPLAVTFTDLTDPGTLTISARSWDVGEGDPIVEDSPTFSYTTPGTYDVSLTITTTQGDKTTTKLGYIQVTAKSAAMKDRDLLRDLELAGLAFDGITGVETLRNGDFLLYGPSITDETAGDLLLVRLDGQGNFLWENVLEGVRAESLQSIRDTEDGDILIDTVQKTGRRLSPVRHRLDAYGNLL